MFLKVIRVAASTAVAASVISGCASQAETRVPTIELPAGDKKVEILGSFSGDEAVLFETELAEDRKSTRLNSSHT